MSKIKLTGKIDYVQGHLRYGHFEAIVDEDFIKDKSQDELKSYLKEAGDIVIDDFEVEDHGDIEKVETHKLEC